MRESGYVGMDLASAPLLAGDRPNANKTRTSGTRCVLSFVSPAWAVQGAFRAQWKALVLESSDPNPFFEPWFALPSLEQFGSVEHSQIAVLYDGERLTGLLPICRPSRYYGYPVPHAATFLHDNAFCGSPLTARGFERAFWQALLAKVDQDPGAALFLHLPQLPSDAQTARALDLVIAESGRQSVIVEQSERAMLASDLSADDYLEQSMSAKKRKELRRQHKRLSEEGALTFERSQGPEDIGQWIAEFLALEAAGWKGDAGSALADAEKTRSLFTEALNGAAATGRLERLALRLDGKPIAMLASFIAPPGVFSFKTTFDERYSRYSPGLLLQIENLALLEREGIRWADSCAAQGHSMIERIWREKRTITSRNIAIGGPLRRAAFRAAMAYETRGVTSPHTPASAA